MILKIVQNITVFGRFLKFLLSNHPKTNTESYSTPQDSTLDTPQGGVLDNFFLTPFCGCGKLQSGGPVSGFNFWTIFFSFLLQNDIRKLLQKSGVDISSISIFGPGYW